MEEFEKLNWNMQQIPGTFIDNDYWKKKSITYKLLTNQLGKRSQHQYSFPKDEECTQRKPKKRKHESMLTNDIQEQSDNTNKAFPHILTNKSYGYIPGFKCANLHGNSSMNQQEKALYLQLKQKFSKTNMTASKLLLADDVNDLAMFKDLDERVHEEQILFNQLLEKQWPTNQVKFYILDNEVNRYITDAYQYRLKRLENYFQYYNKAKTFPFGFTGADKSILLHPGPTVFQMGVVPFIIQPTFMHSVHITKNYNKLCSRYPPSHSGESLKSCLAPVSQDSIAQKLAETHQVDFVISSSGLKHICNSLPPYDQAWDVPIVVKEYETKENDVNVKKTVAYIDKALVKKTMSTTVRNQWYHKIGVKQLLCHPKHSSAYRFPYQTLEVPSGTTEFPSHNGMETEKNSPPVTQVRRSMRNARKKCLSETSDIDSEISSQPSPKKLKMSNIEDVPHPEEISSERESDNVSPESYFSTGNVTYQLWSLLVDQDDEVANKSRVMMKQVETSQRVIKVLVRTKTDGTECKDKGEAVCISPKLEYKLEHGGEKLNKNDVTRDWLSLLFHPNSSLLRVHIDALSSEVFKLEKRTFDQLTNEMKLIAGFETIPKMRSTLFMVLSGLLNITPGQYMLMHTATMGPFVLLQRGQEKSGNYDLRKAYSQVDPTALPLPGLLPWRPIDGDLMMPHHIKFQRIPATFQPCSNNKTQYNFNKGTPKNIVTESANVKAVKKKKLKKKNIFNSY